MFLLLLFVLLQICAVNSADDETWRKSVERRIDLLQRENQELKKNLENLSFENKHLKDDLDLVKKRCISCGSPNTREDNIADDKLEMPFLQDMEKAKTDSGREMVNRRDKEPVARIIPPASSLPVSAVAFYSYMSTNSASTLSAHHTLIYDIIQINRGNGYNKDDGIFIAPVSGTYVFHFSVCVETNAWVSLEIVVNGKAIGAVYEHSESRWHEGSNLVITDVNAGDHVFIRTHEAAMDGHAVHSNARGRTSFSGWLLYQ